jgi:hypothetical protein
MGFEERVVLAWGLSLGFHIRVRLLLVACFLLFSSSARLAATTNSQPNMA